MRHQNKPRRKSGQDPQCAIRGASGNQTGETWGELVHYIRDLNGAPALVSEFGPRADRYAERVVTRIELGPDGLIAAYDSVLATDKVRHLFSPAP